LHSYSFQYKIPLKQQVLLDVDAGIDWRLIFSSTRTEKCTICVIEELKALENAQIPFFPVHPVAGIQPQYTLIFAYFYHSFPL
jgi:hypothetical protein